MLNFASPKGDIWLTVTPQEIEKRRLDDLTRFYSLLDRLEKRFRGKRTLRALSQFEDWPPRGVYFFFERSEVRKDSGKGPRVVRVGTHGVADGVGSTLYQRLRQHRGTRAGGGNHRASIFRLLVGQALIAQGKLPLCSSWAIKPRARASQLLGCRSQDLIRNAN
jgi:hypothetical protein